METGKRPRKDNQMTAQTEPTGKRTIRITVRGSIMGYIGRTRWECFGERSDPAAMASAQEWLNA
jgi:hypothetical protein